MIKKSKAKDCSTHSANKACKASTPCKCSEPAKASKCNRAKKACIKVTADVGYGNVLFIRGSEEPLNWDKGIALQNVDTNHWSLELDVKAALEFKLLINDEQWNDGDNYALKAGETISIEPSFSCKA